MNQRTVRMLRLILLALTLLAAYWMDKTHPLLHIDFIRNVASA